MEFQISFLNANLGTVREAAKDFAGATVQSPTSPNQTELVPEPKTKSSVTAHDIILLQLFQIP